MSHPAARSRSDEPSDFDSGPYSLPDAGSLRHRLQGHSATYLVGASSSRQRQLRCIVNSIDPDNELIQGVEDFQVQFGVNNDNDLGADRYVDADNVGAANWNNVVSVRLTLQLNTVDPVQAGATIAKDFHHHGAPA